MSRFTPLKNLTSWRRIALATWRAPNDPTVYGSLSFDWTRGQQFLDTVNKEAPVKITVTHFMAKVVALVLARFHDLNGIIRWNRIYLRNQVDIFLQVAVYPPLTEESRRVEAETAEEKPDLSGAKIENCDKKSLAEIASKLKAKSQMIRKREDPQFQATLNLLRWVPPFLLSWGLKLMGFLIYNLGIDLPSLGLVADPFGSAMVTSVGMLGMPPGHAPLVPFSRCPLIVCVGAIEEKPWVVDGQVCVRPVLELATTFDHRFMDGLRGAQMAHFLREIIENPEKFMEQT